MFAVSVSPTCGVPGIDAVCWVGASPLQGNAAANYGGGEVARRSGVALSLERPGDDEQWERR